LMARTGAEVDAFRRFMTNSFLRYGSADGQHTASVCGMSVDVGQRKGEVLGET
jgi:hypothetical protein